MLAVVAIGLVGVEIDLSEKSGSRLEIVLELYSEMVERWSVFGGSWNLLLLVVLELTDHLG